MGLPPPQFREISEFVVTFSKTPVTASAPISTKSGTLWDTETRQLNITADVPLLLDQERRMQQAMQYVREYGVITNTVYRELTSVSEATARRDLETLVERGALRETGKCLQGSECSLMRFTQEAVVSFPMDYVVLDFYVQARIPAAEAPGKVHSSMSEEADSRA